MVKQNQGKIFQAGIFVGIILFVLGWIEGYFSGGLYTTSDPALWKSMTGNWWVYMLFYNLIFGLILALVYTIFNKSIPGEGINKGIQFGFWIWLVGTVPGLLITLITMAVPAELVVIWLVSGLLNLVVAGIVLGAVMKFKE